MSCQLLAHYDSCCVFELSDRGEFRCLTSSSSVERLGTLWRSCTHTTSATEQQDQLDSDPGPAGMLTRATPTMLSCFFRPVQLGSERRTGIDDDAAPQPPDISSATYWGSFPMHAARCDPFRSRWENSGASVEIHRGPEPNRE